MTVNSKNIKKAYRAPAEWKVLIEEQKADNGEIKKFCRLNDILIKTFYHWRVKLGYSSGLRGGIRKKSVARKSKDLDSKHVNMPSPANNNNQKTNTEIGVLADYGELNQQEREHRKRTRERFNTQWASSKDDRLLAISSNNHDSATAYKAYQELVKERKATQYARAREAEIYHLEK